MLLPESLHAVIVGLTLICLFACFVREWLKPDVAVMSAVALLMALGLLAPKQVLSVFSNSAPITIACLFIISGALSKTGCVDRLGEWLGAMAGRSERRLLLAHARAWLAGVAVHQQHAGGDGDDSGGDRDGRALGRGAVAAADPALLRDHSRRHDHHGRHLDQHPGRWRRARAGAGAVPDVRDQCSGHRHRLDRQRLHSLAGAAPAAGARDLTQQFTGSGERLFMTELFVPEGSHLAGQTLHEARLANGTIKVLKLFRGDDECSAPSPRPADGRRPPGRTQPQQCDDGSAQQRPI
jgi:hypothetical protein